MTEDPREEKIRQNINSVWYFPLNEELDFKNHGALETDINN